jgi:capsular polysaccharide export protein
MALALFGASRERALLVAAYPDADAGPPAAVAVWSGSRYRQRALGRAQALGVPALLIGPGLLRPPPGWGKPPPMLSLTAHAVIGPPSAADGFSPDRVLLSCDWETGALLDRATAARRTLAAGRVGGAWWNGGGLPDGDGLAFVLANEAGSSGVAGSLEAMMAAALAENAAEKIVLLASPRRDRQSPLAKAAARGCVVVTHAVDPWAVIERARRVYCAGGETGFLALLAGRDVRCFGDCFYSGWGVTDDGAAVAQKPFRRTVDEIFAGACLLATHCLDPYHKIPAAFEDVAAVLAEWRQVETANRGVVACLGMSWWKRRWVAEFFRSAAGAPKFRRRPSAALGAAAARPGGAIAVWASRMPAGFVAAAARQGTPLIQVEDGFVRSVGLGSDFVRAASLALDASGSHCDPDICSDLERLLRETRFDPALLLRARDLTARLVARGITKYNLVEREPTARRLAATRSGARGPPLDLTAGRRRLLVPGQVEDDLSVRLGGGDIRGNLGLLGCVRAANPHALILYKPHPDVEAGHRRGALPSALAEKFADYVIGGSTAIILDEVDEVHTLTSLTGFEALLRERKVVVYGRPFYAGWGLTNDRIAIGRGRRLTLEELVAGVLILYPRYLDPVTRLPCAAEIAVDRLARPELWRPGPLVAARRLHGLAVRRWSRLLAGAPVVAGGLR